MFPKPLLSQQLQQLTNRKIWVKHKHHSKICSPQLMIIIQASLLNSNRQRMLKLNWYLSLDLTLTFSWMMKMRSMSIDQITSKIVLKLIFLGSKNRLMLTIHNQLLKQSKNHQKLVILHSLLLKEEIYLMMNLLRLMKMQMKVIILIKHNLNHNLHKPILSNLLISVNKKMLIHINQLNQRQHLRNLKLIKIWKLKLKK